MSWFSKKTPEQKEYAEKQKLQKRFMKAIYNEKIKVIEECIEIGADVTQGYDKDEMKRTPMGAAVSVRSIPIIQLLLDEGADINKASKHGDTTLISSISSYDNEISLFLLENGANPKLKEGYYDRTPLMQAAMKGQTKVLKALLEKSSENINDACRDGMTALHFAAYNNNVDCVCLLCEHGANVFAKDKELRMPVDQAKRYNYWGIVSYLEEQMGIRKGANTPTKEITNEWVVTKPFEIAHIFDEKNLGYRITEIFNFQTQVYTEISRNLETNAESKAFLPFRDFAHNDAIELAREKLEKDKKSDMSKCTDVYAKPAMIKKKTVD